MKRRCLKCDCLFSSQGIGNRLCNSCNCENDRLLGNGRVPAVNVYYGRVYWVGKEDEDEDEEKDEE